MVKRATTADSEVDGYAPILSDMLRLVEESRRISARGVNSIMTATYWEIGRRIVEYEQKGEERAEYYGEQLLERLAQDLSGQFGRGCGRPTFACWR